MSKSSGSAVCFLCPCGEGAERPQLSLLCPDLIKDVSTHTTLSHTPPSLTLRTQTHTTLSHTPPSLTLRHTHTTLSHPQTHTHHPLSLSHTHTSLAHWLHYNGDCVTVNTRVSVQEKEREGGVCLVSEGERGWCV